MKCHFCKKRVWFWQSAFWSYHTRCYSEYLNGLAAEPLSMFDTGEGRRMLLAELRELGAKFPALKLRVPLQ